MTISERSFTSTKGESEVERCNPLQRCQWHYLLFLLYRFRVVRRASVRRSVVHPPPRRAWPARLSSSRGGRGCSSTRGAAAGYGPRGGRVGVEGSRVEVERGSSGNPLSWAQPQVGWPPGP